MTTDSANVRASEASAAQREAADASSGADSSETPPQGIRVGKLDTLEDVRRELGRLYRAARRASGAEPDAATAAKLAYLLQAVGRTIEGGELERRVMELERKTRRENRS
ncbi:MAG: hypothetical protein M0Z99_26830 [Betaproteobacteria bacterium]|nr:hypothetical protein [Betaproteobacteria bacterium]